ncbi:hypothetical protein GCM10028794_20380 [Silanimonas algicola]
MTFRRIDVRALVRHSTAALFLALAPLAGPLACAWRVQMPSIESFTRPGPGGELEGYAVDVVREGLRRIGCTPQFVELPGPRSWEALRAGELDLLFGARPSAEREPIARFLGPIDHAQLALYVRREAMGDAPLRALADVRGTRLRIGIERLSSYGPEYDALLDDAAFLARLRIVISREAGIAMLAGGRLDAVFADDASAGRLGGVDVVRAVALTPVPVHIAVSRVSIDPRQSEALAAALDAMAADGTLDRLRAAAGFIVEAPVPEKETPP